MVGVVGRKSIEVQNNLQELPEVQLSIPIRITFLEDIADEFFQSLYFFDSIGLSRLLVVAVAVE